MAAAAAGYRSGFEQKLAARLVEEKVPFVYESETFPILLDAGTAECPKCGKVKAVKRSRYTPDFFFKNWVIEAKGKFAAKDRKRLLGLRDALLESRYPRKLGILFMRDNWMTKRKKQRYTDWCAANGINAAVGWFKPEWLR